MNEAEKLELYLQKLREIASEKVEQKNTPALQALKEALNFIEGEMIGY